MAAPWNPYSVGAQITTGAWGDCTQFSEVSHTAHVAVALNMVREGIIRSRLVYDQSVLQTERVPVVWLSPNRWKLGSRYGSVEFWFDWSTTVQGKVPYWVEAITTYNPAAPRILLTNRNVGALPVQPYDPAPRDGPWATIGADHHRNGTFTLEFMHEEDLSMNQVQRIDFVYHSDQYCSVHRDAPADCPEFKIDRHEARNRFIAGLVSGNLHAIDRLFVDGGNPNVHLKEYRKNAEYEASVERNDFKGRVLECDPEAELLIRAFVSAQRINDVATSQQSRFAFASPDDFLKALMRVLSNHFGVTV